MPAALRIIRGFVPYGPSRAGAESLSLIMAEDLRPHGVAVNMLLPGGAIATGMIPNDVPQDLRDRLLSPDVMAKPILHLCSTPSDGVSGEHLVATTFANWLREHERQWARDGACRTGCARPTRFPPGIGRL